MRALAVKGVVFLVALREYFATFITDPVCLDVLMLFVVVLLVSAVLKVFCFGLYK